MRNKLKFLAIPVLAALAACGRSDDSRPEIDDALRNDLSLASSAQPYQPQPYMSPIEAGYMQQGYGQPQLMTTGTYSPAAQPAPVYRAPTATRPRTTTRTSSGTVARSPQVVKRNTKRDAIIGATAGAAIGVATSRDKVKGGLIGAAVGGLAGAVIGHTVDVERQ